MDLTSARPSEMHSDTGFGIVVFRQDLLLKGLKRKDMTETDKTIADDYMYLLSIVSAMRDAQINYYRRDKPSFGTKVAYNNMLNKEFAVDMFLQAELTGKQND